MESQKDIAATITRWKSLCEGWRKARAEKLGLEYRRLWRVRPVDPGSLETCSQEDRVMVLFHEMEPGSHEHAHWTQKYALLAWIPAGELEQEKQAVVELQQAELKKRLRAVS